MGVAGSGKSTIGEGVAAKIGGTYVDGDDLHPQANIDKMSAGEALTDEDRWPWLTEVGRKLASIEGVALIGCSALKRSYRQLISQQADEPVQFIYLDGSRNLIGSRMAARKGHFMPTSLLDSQFATLEIPGSDENVFSVSIDATIEDIIGTIAKHIAAQR